ncbi:MAG TPA: hypothetical protein VGL81_28205 [Polyangiaceae bacterium]|jgi:hypothetical protein
MAPICPQCGREAPIVYRGVVPYCTACGALRAPLSGPSINHAGKPSRVGGTFASVLGWVVLVCGGSLTLFIALLFLAFHALAVGLAVALPVAIVVLVAGISLLRSGRSLSTSGEERARSTREQALLAVAAHRGAVTAADAARALGVGTAEADAMLTALAKREPERVAVDVDDEGVVWYRVSAAPGEPIPRMRVGDGVRVEGRDEVQAAVDDVQGPVASRAPR